MRNFWCCLLLYSLIISCASAQKFFVTTYGEADGLPTNSIRQIISDGEGYRWIATDAGLVRFNGRRFDLMQDSLESRYIHYLQYDSVRQQIMLSNDAGLFDISLQPKPVHISRTLTATATVSDSSLHYPNQFYRDRQNRIWISQPNQRVSVWQNGQLQHFDLPIRGVTKRSDYTHHFVEDSNGQIWVVAEAGQLYRFDEATQQLNPIRRFAPTYDVLQIQDTLWLAGDHLSCVLLRAKAKPRVLQSFQPDFSIRCLAINQLGQFYAGTRDEGLFQLDISNRQLQSQKVFGSNDPHRVNELPFQDIRDIFIVPNSTHPSGEIWLSTEQGIGLLHSRFFDGVSGIAYNNTFAITTRPNARIVLSFGNVYEIEKKGANFRGELLGNIGRYFVSSLAATQDKLWMGTNSGILLLYNGRALQKTFDFSERGAGIFFNFVDHKERLWFAQAPSDKPIPGIARIEAQNQVRYFGPDEGLTARMLVARENDKGQIYLAGIGKDSYLFRYLEAEDRFLNLSPNINFQVSPNFEVHDMAIDHRGLVWLGTTDGLLCYDLERVQRIDLGVHTTEEVRALTAMPDGTIWLAIGTTGLLCYRNDGQLVAFDETSGLPTTISSYRCMLRDNDNHLWVGTAEGVVRSVVNDPRPVSSQKPNIVQIKTDDQWQPYFVEQKLQLHEGTSLAVDFISTVYPGDDVRYQYRIQGESPTEWSLPQDSARINITAPPTIGGYRLQIRALQSGGFDWSDVAEVNFSVKARWYQRLWVQILLGILAFLFFWSFLRIRIWRLLKRIRSLERLQASLQETIRQKDARLRKQSEVLTHQSEEIEHASHSIHHLHEIIQRLPSKPSIEEVLSVTGKVLAQDQLTDRLELAYVQSGQLISTSYYPKERKMDNENRHFDEKASLADWLLAHRQSLLIKDYKQEIKPYLAEPQPNYPYPSIVGVPFNWSPGKFMVVIQYSKQKNAFDEYDTMTLQVLTDFLSKGMIVEM